MTSEPWQVIGTIASTAGVTTFAIGGAKSIVAGYQTYVSPYTSLTEAERRLERVRSRLQGLSPKRREEIEIATRSESYRVNGLNLESLEERLDDLTEIHIRLGKRIEETTFKERHYPFSTFRAELSAFEVHARSLLNDTLTTTVPHVDDIEFKPETLRRATERPSSFKPTFDPENPRRSTGGPSSSEPKFDPKNSRRSTERPSSSRSSFSPEDSRRSMDRSSGSTEYFPARESFSDPDDIPLSRVV